MPRRENEEWYRLAFDSFYADLYAHRDDAEAHRLVGVLVGRFRLRPPVLDVACGSGRFLRALAALGIPAAGVDLSRPLLRRARASDGGPALRLVRGDMRSLPVSTGRAGSILLLFTSFGYFESDEENLQVLLEVYRALGAGGLLVLDFVNARRVAKELVRESSRQVGGRLVLEHRWVDPSGPYLRKRVQVGPDLSGVSGPEYEERVRLYTPEDLRALCRRAGFEGEAELGDYDGVPFEEERSSRWVFLGRATEKGVS